MAYVCPIVFLAFTALSLFVCVQGIRKVLRVCPERTKPFWLIGSLVGVLGLGIEWSAHDDLVLEFGVQVPLLQFAVLMPAGVAVTKTMFPVVAMAALLKDWPAKD